MNSYRVLVIGPRSAILDVLRTRDIPFAVWREKTGAPVAGAQQTVTAPLWNSTDKLRQILRDSFAAGRYTHVIAGTEAAVYPAAVARRVLGARLSPTTTALRCHDKLAMKEYLSGKGIPMTDFLSESSVRTARAAFARLGSPLVRKSRKSSGGRGLELVYDEQDLQLRHDGRNILERYVEAQEASIESFVKDGAIRFVNTTRYLEKGHVNFVPSGLDDGVLDSMLALNRRVIEALKIDWGITHLEVYLTDRGVLFGEIALRPPGGYIMNAMRHAWAFDPWAAWIALELGEEPEFPDRVAAWCCADIFHPGPGQVIAIDGAEWAANHPDTREFQLKVQPGDVISRREGLGQNTGYLLFASASPGARLELYRQLRRQFSIQVRH